MGLTQSNTNEYPAISKFPNVKTRIDSMFNTHKNNLYTEGSIKTYDIDVAEFDKIHPINNAYQLAPQPVHKIQSHNPMEGSRSKPTYPGLLLTGGRGKVYVPEQVTYQKYDPTELKKYLQNGGDINNLSESITGIENSEMNQLKQMRDYLTNDINIQKTQPSISGGNNSSCNLKAIFDNEVSPTTSVSVDFRDILKNVTNKNLKGGRRAKDHDNFVEESVTETYDLDEDESVDKEDNYEDNEINQDDSDNSLTSSTNLQNENTQDDYSDTSNNESEGLVPFYSEDGSDYEFRQATHPNIKNRFT